MKIRMILATSAVALATVPFAGAAGAQEIPSAGGCATQFAMTPYSLSGGTVTIGSQVIIDPRPAQSLVLQVESAAFRFVNCVV